MRKNMIKEKRKDLQGRPEEIENRKEKKKMRKKEKGGEQEGGRIEVQRHITNHSIITG